MKQFNPVTGPFTEIRLTDDISAAYMEAGRHGYVAIIMEFGPRILAEEGRIDYSRSYRILDMQTFKDVEEIKEWAKTAGETRPWEHKH